jgi:hypothetical protein
VKLKGGKMFLKALNGKCQINVLQVLISYLDAES